MLPFNVRWVCGRLKRARRLWIVVSLIAILVLVGTNFKWTQTTARDLSDDGKNRKDLTTFIDPHKAFDVVRRGSGWIATSSADLKEVFDSRKRVQYRLKRLRNRLDAEKANGMDENDPLSGSVDLKKAFDEKDDFKLKYVDAKEPFDKNNDSKLKSFDLKNAFESKKNGSKLKHVETKKALDSKKSHSKLKSVDLKKAFDSKTNKSKVITPHRRDPLRHTPVEINMKKVTDEELPAAFAHKLTGQEKSTIFEILKALDTVSAKLDQPYFLCGGTLLGSFRHHDLIPWDDDIDVYMNLTERDAIYSGLSSLSPTFKVLDAGYRLKLYSQWSKTGSQDYSWKYPYVDINFFIENATHIIDSDPVFNVMAYRKEKIFPLHRRPLGGLFLLAPFDTYSYLTNTYSNITLCVTSYYDHRNEVVYADKTVWIAMCSRLKGLFPFVYRTRDPDSDGIRETQRLGDTELHTIVVDEPQYTVGDVFHLIPLNETWEDRHGVV